MSAFTPKKLVKTKNCGNKQEAPIDGGLSAAVTNKNTPTDHVAGGKAF